MPDVGVSLHGILHGIGQTPVIRRDAVLMSEVLEENKDYQQGRLEDAKLRLSAMLADADDFAGRLSLLVSRLAVFVASGECDAAYETLMKALPLCVRALERENSLWTQRVGIISALSIETILSASVFDIPLIDAGVDDLPIELKAHYGYLLAQRYIRMGNPAQAEGVAYAFLNIVGNSHPRSQVELLLTMACATVMTGRVDEASTWFNRAWELSDVTGVVMPFVELNYAMLGLQRRCLDMRQDERAKRIATLVRRYHKGWFGLRQRCNLYDAGHSLTPLEMYTLMLVAYGWRNKEMATQLRISENTVKHYLSNVYTKIGVRGRAGAREHIDASIHNAEFRYPRTT